LGRAPVIAFAIAGLAMAAAIEVREVFYYHKWIYKADMPTLFGIGLSPLVQLSVPAFFGLADQRSALWKRALAEVTLPAHPKAL
jgi:hypothetical protein